jgi:hypothetical protein
VADSRWTVVVVVGGPSQIRQAEAVSRRKVKVKALAAVRRQQLMKTQVVKLTAAAALALAPQPHSYRTVNNFRLLSTFEGHTAFLFPFVLFCGLLSL